MKRVLVPIDFSEASMNALEFGLQIANLLKADLRVMHVVTGKHYAPSFDNQTAETLLRGRADEWMEIVSRDFKPRYDVYEGTFDAKIREGNVTKEIVNQAKYDDTSLIVLGSHGISGFEDKWIGSNAYKLVSSAGCPVLLVRKEMQWKPFMRIVLPIDLKAESRLKVPVVAGFAKLFNAEIHIVGLKQSSILFITNRLKSAIRQVQDYIEQKAGLQTRYAILQGSNMPQKLIDYGASVDADLLSVQIHHEKGLFLDLIRPFVNDVINYADRPVLVVPSYE
jgi:nucleotide-binding universal stress UspA family protein